MLDRIAAPPLPAAMLRQLTAVGFVPVLLVVLVILLGIAEPRFLSEANFNNVLRNASYLAIISSGQMLVMILGGIDLSVGVVVALSSVSSAILMSRLGAALPGSETIVVLVACAAVLALATLVGAINGLLVARTGASAFMITLGTFSVVGGIAFYVTSGIPIYGMPTAFTRGFGRGALLGVQYPILIAILAIGALAWAQRHLAAGRHLYAAGGHAPAARSSGIRVTGLTVAAYAGCSLLAGLTGILITARIGSGQANLGSEFMLQSVSAAVLAGVSLRGGIGRAEMVAVSSLFLAVIANGMNLVRIDSKFQTIVFGILLLAAILIDRRRARVGDHG